MTSDSIILRAVLVLVLIMAAGEIYLFSVTRRLQPTPSVVVGTLGTAVQPPAAPQDKSLEGIQVGDNPVAYQGYITQIQNGKLQVKTPESTVTFALSSNTTYVKQGTQKSYVEYNQELAAYNAKVTELLKDPQNNAAALKALKLPLLFNQIALTLSDFKVGDYVYVTPGTKKIMTARTGTCQ